MTKLELPSRDEIRKLYQAGEEPVVVAFEHLVTVIRQREQRVQSWEDQLAKKSHNNSKPPSSDGYGRGRKRSLRQRAVGKSVGKPVMKARRCKPSPSRTNAKCIGWSTVRTVSKA